MYAMRSRLCNVSGYFVHTSHTHTRKQISQKASSNANKWADIIFMLFGRCNKSIVGTICVWLIVGKQHFSYTIYNLL